MVTDHARLNILDGMETRDDLLGNLASAIFSSLLRRDQRLKAEQYVRALLTAKGRKTLRNIAEQMGGGAAQQSVHHFISSSSWEWAAVRRAHARQAERLIRPEAWVVRPIVIPKVGPHSVGVDQQFVPHLGHSVNAQQAFGAWLASERVSVPGNWRLVLPRSWLEDDRRRSRAHIPASSRPASLEEHATGAFLDTADTWGLCTRPVVMDVEGLDAVECARCFDRAAAPMLMRIAPETRLCVDCAVLHSYSDKPTQAGQLVDSMRWFRQQTEWRDGHGRLRRCVSATIPVVLPTPGRQRAMLLLAQWPVSGRRAARLWLTDATELPVASLMRLTTLPRVVERDFAQVSEEVGVRDFAGRSFQGWHRHITLASVAHLIGVMERAPFLSAPGAVRPAEVGAGAGRSLGNEDGKVLTGVA